MLTLHWEEEQTCWPSLSVIHTGQLRGWRIKTCQYMHGGRGSHHSQVIRSLDIVTLCNRMYIVLFWYLLNMVVKHLWQRYVCNGDRIFYGLTINLLSQMTYYWISENIFSDTDITVKGQYQTMYSVGAVLGKMLFNFPVPCQIDHIPYCLFHY